MGDLAGYGERMPPLLDPQTVAAFGSDGAVVLRGFFRDWVEKLAAGVARNEANPSEYFAENVREGESGRFWDDYCNWQRIPEFERFIRYSDAAAIAGELMQSDTVQLFHDHVLVKDAGTATPTPWHSDSPYYFVEGAQTVSLWLPLDPVEEATLRFIKGSHRWERDVLPVKWLAGEDFYPNVEDYLPVPDPDAEPDRFDVIEWALEPGDAVAFHYRTVHGARGNPAGSAGRRAFSVRFLGDDARYVTRPGRTSPPFPGHEMSDGERLRTDWFPILVDQST